MPNLLGMRRAEAEQTLIAYGLTLSAVYEEAVVDSSQVGYVASQTPSAYTEILPGSAVSFTIGKASPSMCSALIEVDLTELPDGTVTVDVVDENGEEQRQYTETFDNGPDDCRCGALSRGSGRDGVCHPLQPAKR